jgi:hypothetical protein
MFSPPDVEVEIYGRRTGDRYLLVVVDYGIGMSAADLAKARARLRDEENFLVAPTRFLGHYVVGRLAKQLNIAVELGDSPVTGITARMLIPAELIIEPSARSTPPAQPVPAQNRGQRPAGGLRRDTTANSPDGEQPGIERAGGERAGVERNGGRRSGAEWNGDERNGGERAGGERHAARQPSRPVVPSRQLPAPVTSLSTAADSSPPGRTGSHAGPVERTRNGLVKRQVRGESASTPPTPSREPQLRQSIDAGGPTGPDESGGGQHRERTANEVGGMLAAFSRGHQRGATQGHSHGQPDPGQTGRTNGRPSPLVQEEDSR